MMEPTHKIVDGIRVDLTKEEILDIKIKWAQSKINKQRRKAEKDQKRINRSKLLDRLGMTEEDAKLLLEVV